MQYEKMRMWQAAEQYVAEVDGIVEQVRFTASNSANHLERSAESVLFNIAEGAGAYRPRVKIGCYEIARKEANEARAVLRRLVLKRVVTDERIRRAWDLGGMLMSMLTKAILTLEERARSG
ncbi:MAG TPA: four helix bundle protein [Longimicrobiales bacterium]|nr:four helix bundle protein [Longimicrobiales bacterium]